MTRVSHLKSLTASLTLAFSLAACSVTPPKPMPAPAPEIVEPKITYDPETTAALEKGCRFYSTILSRIDLWHLTGKTDSDQTDIAQGAYRGILYNLYLRAAYDPVTETFNKTIASFDGPDEARQITSVTLKGQRFGLPDTIPVMENYADHCTYLEEGIVTLADVTQTPIGNFYEYALEGALLASRDPHTIYLSKLEETEIEAGTEPRENIQTGNGKIGIEFGIRDGLVKILKTPLSNTPAYKAGLRAGDLIEKIDGKPVYGLSLYEAGAYIGGEPGTPVNLTVRRHKGSTFNVRVTRENFTSRDALGELVGPDKNIAHINLYDFSYRATFDFVTAFKELEEKAEKNKTPLKSIILDVRNNRGGRLLQGISIADRFLEQKPGEEKYPIVATGKTADERIYYVDSSYEGIMTDLPVVLLQNQSSASASEIVSGAFQDAGKPIIGTRSFGKGTVQYPSNVNDEGGIEPDKTKQIGEIIITAAAFFPGKTGLSNQGSGIIPDIKVQYNDARDQMAEDARRETKLEKALVSTEKTRAGMTPEQICSLKDTFAGPLSKNELAKLPPELIRDVKIQDDKNGEDRFAQMLDADLACAIHYLEGTSPYTILHKKEQQGPVPTS